MNVVLKTAPSIEPLALLELCDHLRIKSDTFAESLDPYTCTPAGSHPVVTGYTLLGTGIEVLGKKAIVCIRPTNNGAGATVDCKIQESDTDVSANYTDWTGGAFTQITEASDTIIQKKEYTGNKRYIRTASKTLVNACDFGTDITVESAEATLSDDLTDAITDGREIVENHTRRALLSQTWLYYLPYWPSSCRSGPDQREPDRIVIPFGNLQDGSGTAPIITYKDSDGTVTTMTVDTDYLVQTNGEQCGKIVLPEGVSWPTATLWPSNPICIEFTCGWASAALLPRNIKRACKFAAEDLYYHGNRHDVLKPAIESLLVNYRLPREF